MRLLYFILLGFIILVTSCQDVIEVEVPTGETRLIIDALMRVDITQEFIGVKVKVTETNNFFEELPVTSLENITIIYSTTRDDGLVLSTGTSSLIDLDEGSGVYVPNPNFSTEQRIRTGVLLQEEDVLFTLIIEHKGRKYAGQTRYAPSSPIISLAQGDKTLFSEDETEVIVAFEDDPDIDNFYVFDFDFDQFLVTEDTFYNGQEFEFSYFYDKNIDAGQEITVSILGADRTFYNYMDELITQSEEPQGPFQTPVTTVRGNVFDITGLDNIDIVDNAERPNDFPLGYFAIVQEFKRTLTIE
ncbi:DUF4249 family protein [Maribacter sp. 2307UL18-2]|uniref:DUF4249 family protein n=1 Tax=Maribacter sp. 2307UL18-2 TaxID=3386274 RepID=UPI0039BC2B5E